MSSGLFEREWIGDLARNGGIENGGFWDGLSGS